MPADTFVPVAIPLYYQGHAYRAGTRIRVTIAAPNGAQPVWSFGHTVPTGTSKVAIGFGVCGIIAYVVLWLADYWGL